MIKKILDLEPNIIGFEATGTVTGKDYEEIMIPAIEEKLKTNPKLKFLYYIDAEFEHYELKAMLDDTKIGLKHFNAWEKMAIVTDLHWIKNGVNVFGFIIPGEIKVFDIIELEDAKAWIQK